MSEQIESTAAIAGHHPALEDVELGALPVELRLGDVAPILQARRIGEALAEHERDEGHRWRLQK